MKKYWKIAENYLLYKDWFDSGKNPNKEKLYFDDILSGKYDNLFLTEFKPWILKEIKEFQK